MNIDRKVIIVGASSGLGKLLATKFINDGWIVGIASRNLDELNKIKLLDPDRIHVAGIDVTDPHAGTSLLRLIDRLGGMDLYLHCAGILKDEENLEGDIQAAVVMTNAVGFSRLISCAFEYFRKSERIGEIAAITSIAGFRGLERLPAYSASKAFDITYLEALSQRAHALRMKLKITDIRPGWTRTPLLDSGRKYLLEMDSGRVADIIYGKIMRRTPVSIIGWRWKILTFAQRLLPRSLWIRLHIPIWK